MHTQPQLCLELEAPPLLEELPIKDGDFGVPSSSPVVAASQKPVKKQTRQWAAWTREEEENFFIALRQVGKNFDKITCRVQSKNKDQVRHYYYRLVRRMNKLLGPGFILDAKNSKDTNAAMLRWWSLLEKYSCNCKAAQLRSKPRRFKIFIEALENQLLKDRKRTKRKQPSQGEGCSSAPSATFSLLSKAPGNDARSLKLVIVDSQNIQKVGSGKGVCLKRSVSTTINSNKCDSSTVKAARQRRKTGPALSAAYKKWEKAAMAGVSLVADAAEQLERASTETKGCPDQGTAFELPREPFPSNREKDSESVGVIHSFSSLPSQRVSAQQQLTTEASIQPSMKLKLQLFPIDDGTRKTLEKDEHNPHLELTLSARKKISSVLEHLNRKWGNSVIGLGELMLFPFSIQQENLFSYQRWTLKDTVASAAEVYAATGSPAVFRLRYGWFSTPEFGLGTQQMPPSSLCSDICVQSEGFRVGNIDVDIRNEKDVTTDVTQVSASPIHHLSKQLMVSSKNIMEKTAPLITNFTEKAIKCDNPLNHISKFSEHTTDTSSLPREAMDNMVTSNGNTLSAGEWADSLTNLSIGDLLCEASRAADANHSMGPPPAGGSDAPCLPSIPFSCDSFDAAIAAHLSGSKEMPSLPTSMPHSSIWDSEETCDGFSFRKIPALDRDVPSLSGRAFGACSSIPSMDSMGFHGLVEEFKEVKAADPRDCEPKANIQSDLQNRGDPTKNLAGLTDIYWPDSLGPLDLDISPAKYQGHDLILGDSTGFSGLNRLIASSLDAFQNCVFCSSDKKEATEGEVIGSASFLDHQIGGKV